MALMERAGHHFRNENLLRQALTHSSFANEHKNKGIADNERLEFLGDAVLELVSSEFLYGQYSDMPEGKMTRLRASLVCEPTLAMCARQIGLPACIRLGHGEELGGGRERDSIVSDAFEALIGAVYLDGGLADAKEFIHRFVLDDIEHKKLFFDSKTILQEFVQGEMHGQELSYELISEDGPDHAKSFTVRVLIGDRALCTGKGSTKKAAEQEAAYKTLLKFEEDGELSKGTACI